MSRSIKLLLLAVTGLGLAACGEDDAVTEAELGVYGYLGTGDRYQSWVNVDELQTMGLLDLPGVFAANHQKMLVTSRTATQVFGTTHFAYNFIQPGDTGAAAGDVVCSYDSEWEEKAIEGFAKLDRVKASDKVTASDCSFLAVGATTEWLSNVIEKDADGNPLRSIEWPMTTSEDEPAQTPYYFGGTASDWKVCTPATELAGLQGTVPGLNSALGYCAFDCALTAVEGPYPEAQYTGGVAVTTSCFVWEGAFLGEGG